MSTDQVLSKPFAKDLSHHLSAETLAREASGMKKMAKLLKPGVISLAGGMPHASLFPVSHASFEIPDPSLLTGSVKEWKQLSEHTPKKVIHLDKKGNGGPQGVRDISSILQYGLVDGNPELVGALKQIMSLVHGLPNADTDLGLTLGCTDGVSKTWTLLCETGPGKENVLAEEFTFTSSLSSGRVKGITFWPVAIDGDGMIPESLDEVMTNWDVEKQGKKPHMVYTIPVGQNPTGTCPTEERYNSIYAVAQKHDLIIMEDDPYFWLQYQDYTPDIEARQAGLDKYKLPPLPASPGEEDVPALMAAFNNFAGRRSFLSRDVDGRVVRLDSFSKMFAPGLRMGWFTSNANFVERLTRIGETTTQAVNGTGQALVASILDDNHGWGTSGFLRWIYGVRLDYQEKRDFYLDNLTKHVSPEYATTVPAKGGMFQWLEIHIHKHPRFTKTEPAPASGPATNTVALMAELWQFLLDRNLLAIQGVGYSVPLPQGFANGPRGHVHDKCNFLRTTFAGEIDAIQAAMEILGPALEDFFKA